MGNSTCRASNAIISSTSVAAFIMFTSDGERKGDNTVIRKSCPDNVWCWITISCTIESHPIRLLDCPVIRNVNDIWWICIEDITLSEINKRGNILGVSDYRNCCDNVDIRHETRSLFLLARH